MINKIKSELKKLADPVRAKLSLGYFKTGKGEYGEGDKFLGVGTPGMRDLSKKYFKSISLADTLKLLQTNKYHEERTVALMIMVLKYKIADEKGKREIFKKYLANTKYVNNWDLVDITCRDIVGAYLFHKDRGILYKLAKSKSLWERRIAIISTSYFIGKSDLGDTFKIAKTLLRDKHGLIHKAVGWMLREAGKKNKEKLLKFLNENSLKMPRTMLRYSIEKFSPLERKHYLAKF